MRERTGSTGTQAPIISVLMPTYNAESHVEEAVRSILDQTLSDLELIIQDDGSTDNTVAILKRLAKDDKRITVVPPFDTNRGMIAARNSLLAHAHREFIAWMDSDDRSERERLAIQVAFLRRNPGFGAVGTAIKLADADLRPYRTERFSRDPKRQALDPDICCATIVARREVAEKTGGFREVFWPGGEDGDWLLQLADHSDITNIDDALYTYRQHHSTTKRRPGAIRRLGVLARYAARARRAGRPDPVDVLRSDRGFNYLADTLFLDHPELSVEEKVTALSLPLPGHQRLVSVLIPFYNAGRFFDRCLEHLMEQTYRNFEVLIYDDGSDEPLRLADVQRRLGDIPVRLLRGDDSQGVAVARNRLLTMSEASFVAWQDADGYSRADRLEHQVRYLLANPDCNAVGTAINYLENTIVTCSEHFPPHAFRRRGFSGCCATFMLRKSAANEVGSFNTKYSKASDDVDFLRRIKPLSSVHNVTDILYYYRRHEQQLTERADWVETQAFYFLTQYLEEHGVAPLIDGAVTAEEVKEQFDAFMQLRQVRIDGTPLGRANVRIALQDVKAGRRSPLSLVPLAFRFPRLLARSAIAFARYRGGLLLRGQRPIGLARAEAMPGTGGDPTTCDASRPRTTAKVLTKRPAPIVVRCWDCWGDLDDAICHLTPGGKGIWGKTAFVRETAFPPDWHIVFNAPGPHAVDIEASPNRVMFAIGEPPTDIHRCLQEGQGEGTIVLTSDEQLVGLDKPPRRYVLAPAMTRAWSVKKSYDELRTTRVTDKPRRLSWVTSNATALNGHRCRLAFLEHLKQEVDFDLFGRGFRSIENKWDGLAPYRYSIAFENTLASYYFTEKLMDCFVAEAMPIYCGSPDIANFFPSESMVLIDPEDPDVIAKIKHVVASDLWEKNREAICEAKHLVLEKYNTFAYLAEFMENTTDTPLPPRPMRIKPVVVDFGAEA